MPTLLRCRSDHTWEGSGPCPVCGAEAVTVAPTGPTEDWAGTTAPAAPVPIIPGYDIRGELGGGGMGVVYRAVQLSLHRDVALKVIRTGELAQAAEQKRFLAEAEVVATLRHPNIVQVYDYGVTHGRPYYTMELVEGTTLAKKLAAGSLAHRDGARLLASLARAVHHAHEHGIVHRDLKPENILLAEDGTPKLVDFGVAKRMAAQDNLTEAGRPIGTPSYMAPEQAAGKKEVGPGADVYALGVILYKLLAGRVPFEGDTLYDVLHKIMTADPVSPAWFRPGVPRDLEAICLKCLRKNPAERYRSAAELADDLDRYLNHQRISVGWTPPWRRAAKWVRRHPTATTGLLLVATMLSALAVTAGWYYNRYLRVRVTYYANFVNRWGGYEGLGPLTEEQVRSRPLSYKFYTRGGRVERIDMVDANGELTEGGSVLYMGLFDGSVKGAREEELREASSLDGDTTGRERTVELANHLRYRKRICSYTFEWDDQGRVVKEFARDRDGKVLVTFQYTSPTTGTFTNTAGYPVPSHTSGAAFVDIQRDEYGFLREVRYRDRNNQPTNAEGGDFGFRTEFTPEGLLERYTFLDADGMPFRGADGYAALRMTQNTRGELVEARYLDADGNPTYSREGIGGVRIEYDEAGREIERRNLDVNGNTIPGDNGVAMTRTEFASPFETTTHYLDENARPIPSFFREHRRTERAPDGSRTTTVRFLDADDRPGMTGNWVAGYTLVYDRLGNLTEQAFVDRDGNPTLNKLGFAREVMTYDDDGNLTAHACFDAAGRPTRDQYWVARAEYRYDPAGHRVEERFFGPDGQPTRCQDWYARSVSRWDADGREQSREFFGPDGKPTFHRQGYARIDYEYGDRGWVTRWRFRDPSGRPAWSKEGFTSLVKEYDDCGRELARRCYGPDDRPVFAWSGAHEIRYERDPRGNVTCKAYFATNGRPRLQTDGYCSVVWTLDRYGRTLREQYRGTVGEPVPHKVGFWEVRWEYEPDGYIRTKTYHDRDGNLTPRGDGVARIANEWTGSKHKVERFFDKDNQPIAGPGKVAVTITDYDERNLVVRTEHRDPAGQLAGTPANPAVIVTGYDPRGNLSRVTYFGPGDAPAVDESGVHTATSRYDDRGLLRENTYHDAAGNPNLLRNPTGSDPGWSIITYDYDDRGRTTATRYLTPGRQPTRNEYGIAAIVNTFDARGNTLTKTFHDPNGTPCDNNKGWSKEVWNYSEDGYETEWSIYDVRGGLKVPDDPGYARRLRKYDRWGFTIREEYRGADDQPIAGPYGFARIESVPDEFHRPAEERFFDANGQPVPTRLVINAVLPNSRAAALGLRPGDVMTHYNGKSIPTGNVFLALRDTELATDPPRELRVERDGKPLPPVLIPPGRLGIDMGTRMVPAPK